MSDIPDAGPQPITLDDVGLDARGICGHQLPEGTHLFTVDSLAAAMHVAKGPHSNPCEHDTLEAQRIIQAAKGGRA